MLHPLLNTKMFAPPLRPNLVGRPHLLSRLAAGLAGQLTLVSAPAGFGKTTLVSEWRVADGGATPLAWLSLDDQDNDPQRFWSYVFAVMQVVCPGLSDDALAALRDSPWVSPEVHLTPLLNAVDSPCVLVLDDYHVIESPQVHGGVLFMLEHLPPPLHIVVLTRADPPWPLARLRAQQGLTELRADDLRFSADEAAALLNGVAGGDLSPVDLDFLAERSEGWPVALQLMALSLRGRPDPHDFVVGFAGSHRYVADYLVEEVISRQPAAIRDFLLHTTVLERLSAPLCDAVTGAGRSADLLAQVERANLFLIPLDATRGWYRYHHLFADLLRAHLQRDEPELVSLLHQRAAEWYEAQGLSLDAVRHALAAGDHDLAGRLIEQHSDGWRLWSGADIRLLSSLPLAVVRSRPSVCALKAYFNVMSGRLEAASEMATVAQEALGDAPAPNLRAFLALLQAYIAEFSGLPFHLTEVELQAPKFIPDENVAPRDSAELMVAYLQQMTGDLEAAVDTLAGVVQRDIRLQGYNGVPWATYRLANIRYQQGRRVEAEAICRENLAYIQARGEELFYQNGHLNAMLSLLLLERGETAEAATQAELGQRFTAAWQTSYAWPACVSADVALAQGDAATALTILGAAIKPGQTVMSDSAHTVQALRVQAWLSTGDRAAAERWAAQRTPGLGYRSEISDITLARVWLAEGRPEAAQLLGRLAAAAEAGGRYGRLIEILALQAVAQRSVKPLQRALELAEPEGFVRSMWRAESGGVLGDLLIRAQALGGPAGAYAARLLPAGPGGEPLSPRERDILRLMAQGRSNQEIAAALFVTVGTVKTHVHHIFGKLDVENRTQALIRARELGFL
ncbi:MAG TPA: LuxR C-terminal-related transcriptional regulator [Armatimonadota bacterium]|jgi:LuxR family maltose regulon positive regulatory protein